MEKSQALGVMEDANEIVEDFSTPRYVLYAIIFAIEIALCFWLGLKL